MDARQRLCTFAMSDSDTLNPKPKCLDPFAMSDSDMRKVLGVRDYRANDADCACYPVSFSKKLASDHVRKDGHKCKAAPVGQMSCSWLDQVPCDSIQNFHISLSPRPCPFPLSFFFTGLGAPKIDGKPWHGFALILEYGRRSALPEDGLDDRDGGRRHGSNGHHPARHI
jgi:hypothetical protein